jgi:hypothetical protein
VLPVAALAGKIADDTWHAARWSLYAGGAHAVGVSAIYATTTQCSSTDAVAYIWTPFSAAAGGIIATKAR